MTDRIHDHEADTSEPVVRSLLARDLPELAGSELSPLSGSGTTNALWYLKSGPGGTGFVVRLPRTAGAEAAIITEHRLLPALEATELVRMIKIPEVLHRGLPGEGFPLHWTVLAWIDGDDGWTARDRLDRSPTGLVSDLASVVRVIGTLEGLPAPDRVPGDRGGPLRPLLDRLHRWLDDRQWSADTLIDTAAVRRVADRAAEVADEPVPNRFVHGDLLPGNLLVTDRRLKAVIDWGGAGHGDRAQDLSPAWAVFDRPAREAFRRHSDVDEATWLRAKAFELEHAVGGVLYYRPRRHLLAEVMARTLERILTDRD